MGRGFRFKIPRTLSDGLNNSVSGVLSSNTNVVCMSAVVSVVRLAVIKGSTKCWDHVYTWVLRKEERFSTAPLNSGARKNNIQRQHRGARVLVATQEERLHTLNVWVCSTVQDELKQYSGGCTTTGDDARRTTKPPVTSSCL